MVAYISDSISHQHKQEDFSLLCQASTKQADMIKSFVGLICSDQPQGKLVSHEFTGLKFED